MIVATLPHAVCRSVAVGGGGCSSFRSKPSLADRICHKDRHGPLQYLDPGQRRQQLFRACAGPVSDPGWPLTRKGFPVSSQDVLVRPASRHFTHHNATHLKQCSKPSLGKICIHCAHHLCWQNKSHLVDSTSSADSLLCSVSLFPKNIFLHIRLPL